MSRNSFKFEVRNGKAFGFTVKWKDSIEYMLQEGIDTFIELGPGVTLSVFIKRISKGRNITILNVENSKSLQTVLKELTGG